MKAIRRTKRPTLIQMQNMASNLREKYNKAAMVEVDAWSHPISDTRANYLKYRIWVDLVAFDECILWDKCFAFYKHLMEADYE